MEKLKSKHNHTLTNILKVFTFALVLLFPFLVFMPSALYYGFNEHAQIEIPQKVNTYKTNEVNNFNDLIIGNVYKFEKILDVSEDSNEEYLNDTSVINILDYNIQNILTYEQNGERIATYGNYYLTSLIDIDYIEIPITNLKVDINTDTINDTDALSLSVNKYENRTNYKIKFYFTYSLIEENTILPIEYTFESDYLKETITDTTTISENLSNSWENMWQTPLFQWTENTPFTATTNAFASVFNISHQSGFYNLVAYFITITAIYLVIDIVIGVATMLTHMISKQD